MILWMVKAMYPCYKFLCTKQNSSALYKLKKLLEMETSDKATIKTIFRFFLVWSCLITMNKSSMNIQVNIFVDICFYLSWINKSKIAFHIISICLILKKLSNCFPKRLYFLCPPQQWMSSVIPLLHQHLVLSVVFILAILVSVVREGDGTPLQYSCLENLMDRGAWWAAVHGVAKSWTRLSDFAFTFHFHALENETATHSSVIAWRIPGKGEPGGLPSMGLHRVGHD